MPEFPTAELTYAKMWDGCTVKETRKVGAAQIADKILRHKADYQAVEAKTGVPWLFIGAVHIRESDGDMHTHLHNGDSLRNYTHQVPAGRPKVGHGPPFGWTESAIDALQYEGLHKLDWAGGGVELMLFEEEAYNGWGYFRRHDESPYVWSWTNWYISGKYVADGEYSSTAVDQQPGTAALMKAVAEKDEDARKLLTVRYGGHGVPPGAIARHTAKERTAAGAGAAGAGAAGTTATTTQPTSPGGKVVTYMAGGVVMAIGLAVALVAVVLMMRKTATIKARFGVA